MAFAVVHSQDSPAKTPNYAKNGKNNMKEFIALHNRTVSRDEIQTVIALAKEQNNTEVIYRLSKILNDHPDSNRFNINIINYPQETTQQVALAGTRHSGDYREALDECGRLKKGWHFVDGKVVKVQKRSGLLSQYTEKEFGHPFTKTLKAKFKELNWKYDRKNKRYYTPVPENEAEKEQQAQMFAFIEQEKATLEVNKPEKSPKTPSDKSAPSDSSSNKTTLYKLNFSDVNYNKKIVENLKNNQTGEYDLLKKDMIGINFSLAILEKYLSLEQLSTLYGKEKEKEAKKDYAFVKERIEWAFNHNIKTAKRYHTLNACKDFFAEKLPTLLAKGGQWLEAKAQGKNSATAKGQFTKVVKQTFDEMALIAVLSERDNDEIAFLSAAGIDYFPEAPDDQTQGLGKPVPAADIYKMVTDKIIGMLKSASPTDYHRAWKDDAFFIPLNYDSKKPYRGVNRLLLQERIGFAGAFRNPYFLTFNQIKKHKGTLKKGAKGYEVIYYSIRYVVPADKNSGRKAYSSTNAQKVLDFLHKYKLSEDIVGRIPMIRYYNVYNGADIENIDFKLDELQIGRAVPDSASENRAAQLIVENYPNPPAIKHEGNQAYYNPASDYIKLPKQEQFDTVNDYYRTLFHELTHSTGHNKRLNRGIHLMLEKDDYAKEELVAEFGAVFLSAWAGIMWYNNKNHAAYLKGWNSAIKESKNDNKFLMRAASLAQQATDYILALDKDGNPAFLKKLQGKKAPKKAPKTPTDKSAPSDSSSNKNLFLEEYRQLKAKYPEHLIIFSMEDQQNYTMYGKDAVIAADILNLQLLKGKGNNEFSNSVGFKYNYLREYIEKLVKAGYKVAVRGNDLDKPQSSPKKNKTTKPSNPTKTPIAPTDPMSNELLYFNSVPQRQLVTRIKAKSMKLDFEDEYYNNLADKDGYFKPDFQNKSNLKIITDNCDNFVGTINTYDYPIISVPKPKTTGIMSLKKIVSTDNMRPVMKGVYIDKNHYIATDAHKLVFIPRPKNDEYRTGTIFDINFKCKKLGGCKTEEALIDGHFPIEIINKMKSEENSYISPPLNIENVISHLYCGEKAINIFTTYEKYKVITLYFEKERKTNYINIKHLLDTLEVLRSNGAKTFTLGFLNLEGKRQINIDTDNKLKAIIMPDYYQVNESPTSENCIMIAPINLILYKQFRPKKGLSVPTDGTLFGTLPTFKTRKEAKKYFKAWAAENLTGKKVYHKELDKYVVFSSRGIDHVLSSNISFNKMKLILQAEEMLKNSHLIAFEEDYKKRENIKGVYRMRSNAVLEGEDIKVILTLREGENGVIYYDHKIEEIKESTTPPRKSLANPFCGDSAPTNTPAKTVPNSALSAPRHAGILKEALTEKGKLKKGWYFQDYGIIDPKGKYHPLERDYSLEYNLIEKELRDRAFQQDEKRKIKGFEENKKLEEAIKVFLKELSKENKKHFKNSKAMEVFYWAFPFTLESNSTFYTFEESNPYINKNLQELDKYFSDDNELFERLENYETLRRYKLKSLGLHISAKISSFIDKQGKIIRGDSNKLNQKYGLSAPEVFVEHSPDPATQSAPSITPRNNSLANKMATLQNRTFETFIIAEPQMQAFLGDVERKNTGSTAITITGGAGSGKTRFAFQFINALAQNYKVGHASLEEQPDSKLYFDKVQQYLDQTAQANVEAPEIENMQDLQALIERNDVIVIDSFTKIREWNRNFLLDRDLRKKYNGKLFLIIFQQTVAGNMRGGTTSEFDGDIILYTQVFPDYRENYIYPSKNRYNSTPSEQLRYSVYHQQLLPSESTPPDSSPVTSNTYEVIY